MEEVDQQRLAEKKAMLDLPLDEKIKHSKRLIMDWYAQFDGQVYTAFSGGKDSTVLLHLVRSVHPDVEAVFADTGLEYPEIKEFVRTIDNVRWVKPVFNRKPISFSTVLKRFGFPIISKEQALYIEQWRNAKSLKHKDIRWNGKLGRNGRLIGKISEKWKALAKSDIPITQKCCNIFKKSPFKAYEKETGKLPYTGIMAGESSLRKRKYLRDECNNFTAKHPKSNPIIFWSETDIWKYIRDFDVKYSKIYDMGYDRTGCMFCAYGTHLEKEGDDRFLKMSKTHPRLFDYCMDKLGMRSVLKIYTGREYPTNKPKDGK